MEHGHADTVAVTIELEPETIARIDAIAAREPLTDRDAVVSRRLDSWLRRQ